MFFQVLEFWLNGVLPSLTICIGQLKPAMETERNLSNGFAQYYIMLPIGIRFHKTNILKCVPMETCAQRRSPERLG